MSILQNLQEYLKQYQSAVVALSGGVDSSLVAKLASEVYGDRALAVVSASESLPESERQLAEQLCQQIGIRFKEIKTQELADPEYRANNGMRCFVCKTHLYSELQKYALESGYDAVLDGANADDLSDYRPGRKAAAEHGVISPLAELGIGKAQVRELARELELPNWDKPASACLASRIPYGTEVTRENLTQVEQAEEIMKAVGFTEFRVRHHDAVARLEVPPEEFEKVIELRDVLTRELQRIGYAYISLDLAGFRSGSMNDLLVKTPFKKTHE